MQAAQSVIDLADRHALTDKYAVMEEEIRARYATRIEDVTAAHDALSAVVNEKYDVEEADLEAHYEYEEAVIIGWHNQMRNKVIREYDANVADLNASYVLMNEEVTTGYDQMIATATAKHAQMRAAVSSPIVITTIHRTVHQTVGSPFPEPARKAARSVPTKPTSWASAARSTSRRHSPAT